jgi:tRNA modification GTPase
LYDKILKVIFMYSDDTIAAVSTAPGEGGIGIVRISGQDSLNILNRVFISKSKKNTMEFSSYTLRYGHIIDHDDNSIIDEVLVSYMKSPNTYTREDVVEINCHGGTIPVRRTLELVLKQGARLAEPGEFTKRAFLNGRLDLAQAEAVIDMIRSKTEMSMEAALKQLEGKLSKRLGSIKDKLVDIMSHIEASIDFPEEDVEDVLYDSLLVDCSEIVNFLDDLIKSSDTGKILREGLNTIIIGKPNVGKSSLLNALIEENRAIVTDIPGTTRDIIEEHLNIEGIPVNIIDTAGIRKTEDIIEKIGVEKTREYVERADLVIFVLDSSEAVSLEDIEIFRLIKDMKCIMIINKVDLPKKLDMKDIETYVPGKRTIEVSVKENYGIELIKDEIVNIVYSGEVKSSSEVLVTNIRHKDLLMKSRISMTNAIKTIKMGLPLDLVSIDIRQALEYIGEITGETVQEDIISRIFTQFCIGK